MKEKSDESNGGNFDKNDFTDTDDDENDMHGAGAGRFDTKVEGEPLDEGGARYYNYVCLVRDADL